MSNNMELIQKIANMVGATSTDVDDLIFALCLSERHFGKTLDGGAGGQNKLNIQSAIASGFGIDLKSKTRSIAGVTPLEGIQEKRLICDTCYMLTKGKVEGTELTMPSSAKLIKNRHSDFPYVTDVGVCDEYIELYKGFVGDNGNLNLDILYNIEGRITTLGDKFNCTDELFSIVSNNLVKELIIPKSDKYSKLGKIDSKKSKDLYPDQRAFDTIIVDSIHYALTLYCYKKLLKIYLKNQVEGTILLSDILDRGLSFGTEPHKEYNITPVINCTGFQSHVKTGKIDRIFRMTIFSSSELNDLLLLTICLVKNKPIREVYYEF